jgi:twinkle protein
MGTVVGREPCPDCGSQDNLARYDDGSGYCYSQGCERYEPPKYSTQSDGKGPSTSSVQTTNKGVQKTLQTQGEIQSLTGRKIREDTCQLFGYRVGEFADKPAQLAYYFDPDTRKPVACKVRFQNKDFTFIGEPKQAPLYGQWLWKSGGKKVVITEGEIDALTVSQLQGNKWPVVSVQNGAQGALRSCKKAFDWLDSFQEIVFMFDMDDPGRAAAKECAQLFSPGKAKIADLPLKDPNECLKAGKGDDVINAMWNAKAYRPDGIICGADMWHDIISSETVFAVDYPWSSLNEKTHGLRTAELTTITAGSGIGKSAVVREIAYHLLNIGETVGMIMLEESTKRTALGMMGLAMDTPLHLRQDGVEESDLRTAFDATLGTNRLYLYDHFGSTAIDNLLARVRYMARALGCRWVILDHLSIVVSGLDAGGDERKLIDMAMTMLRTLVQETGIGLILVSHLKRPEGKGHEEGAQTSLNQLRGSHAIAQLSDMVIGLERNQQGENPNETVVRVLKNRFSGQTGVAATLYYDEKTGRLTECPPVDYHEATTTQDEESDF